MAPRNPKPAPVVVRTLCSLCDEEWEAHGDDPTTADCIRLLKAKLAERPTPYTIHYPYYPWWQTNAAPTITPQYTYTINAADTAGSCATVTYLTPRDDEGPDPVGAVA